MLELVLNFLFPQTCVICGKLCSNYICEKCEKRFDKYKKFNIIDNEKLIKDKIGIENINLKQKYYLIDNQKIYWEKMMYCFDYKNIIRKYILQYKFFEKAYLSSFFAYEILNNKKLNEILKSYDIIIPVPMDKIKKSKRGYNQTQLITNIISKSSNILSGDEIVQKLKSTKTQSTLKKEERENNIKDVYVVKQNIKNKNIILFDDIYTTGATINEISKKLKEAGARRIFVLILAKD